MSTSLNTTTAQDITTLETTEVSALKRTETSAVSQNKAKSTSPPRFEGLEAYRGLTALVIICYHCYQHSLAAGADIYRDTLLQLVLSDIDNVVSLFFVLSGFLNFLPFARAGLKQQGAYPMGGFIIKRAIRILPVYYLTLLVVWALRYTGQADQWVDLAEHLTFTQIYDTKHIFWTIGPSWSLAVEFWFYTMLVFLGPCTYWVCGRFKTTQGRTIALYLIPSIFLMVGFVYRNVCAITLHIPTNNYAVYFSLPGRIDNLAMGMLLAVVMATHNNRIPVRKYVPWLIRGIAAIMIITVCYYREVSLDEAVSFVIYENIWGVAMLLVLAAAVLGASNAKINKNAQSQRVWNYLSKISYSIFLWHEPLLIGMSQVLVFTSDIMFPISTLALIATTLGTASLSYWLLEYPVSFLRYLFTKEGKLQPRYTE